MPAGAAYPVHSHPWGEFVYSFSGVMEVRLEKDHLTAPAHYGIWLPPGVEHEGLNRYCASHCSLYLMPELCQGMPESPCALEVNALTISMLEYLRQHALRTPLSAENRRFLGVLRDQLRAATRYQNFLPSTSDPLLAAILQKLEKTPSDKTPLAELAASAGTTLRTLNRRCQETMGIPLNEWRQRLRVVRAIHLLERGEKVENVAFEVGYNSASAFIAMFRRQTGITPRLSIHP
ncbi:AraC family transcriptional regulator [Serratia marcescens]|uniref:AraC family transcriptional regulator n=1 Tax=Serratia marcescens TaxID=615 RepID=UPI000D72A8EE|nr:helix-turn-helix transcriptional regulator [Serratia marcescens]AWO77428.1 AraC family transcriptional regulator [Serratia marcescens]